MGRHVEAGSGQEKLGPLERRPHGDDRRDGAGRNVSPRPVRADQTDERVCTVREASGVVP